jgi:hypothetical protein
MTKIIKLVSVAMFAALTSFGAHANTYYESGNTLMQKCVTNRSECMTYVTGVSDALQDMGIQICLPSHVYSGQLTDITLQYLNDHPAKRHYTASSEILLALVGAFPCSKSNS